MDFLFSINVWVATFLLPIFYFAILIRGKKPKGFRDNLALLAILVLIPAAWLITKLVGDEAINRIQFLQSVVNILTLIDLWVIVALFVASWRFRKPGLAISGVLLFVLALKEDLIQNNLMVLLFYLLSFLIGFSEKLAQVGWDTLSKKK